MEASYFLFLFALYLPPPNGNKPFLTTFSSSLNIHKPISKPTSPEASRSHCSFNNSLYIGAIRHLAIETHAQGIVFSGVL